MDLSTSKGNERKRKMKNLSDMPTPRFELRWLTCFRAFLIKITGRWYLYTFNPLFSQSPLKHVIRHDIIMRIVIARTTVVRFQDQ